ncbi:MULTISPECIES: HEAT repeat domain-containing protein [Actinomadura]|uniref:HEAT repeat domain-containing protein n=1 Tax=Actinomadura TaxID=1988 RepID=UPI001F10697A|nr:HEAT repeat domain-containing protein [Actinomadura geliboluensis]
MPVGRSERLADDADDLVRAAALEALAGIGCPAPLDAAAATALGSLVKALDGPNLDVRKAAVINLGRWAGTETDAADALRRACSDPDADVRAYARRSLTPAP